ncbi:MAG: hypothetical protein ACRCXB_08855 [Aeromonadaceae bacterium]
MKNKKETGDKSAWKHIDRMVEDRIKSGVKGEEVKFIERWKAALKSCEVK